MAPEKHQSLPAYKSVKRWFRNPRICVWTTFFLGTAIALLITAVQGIPAPYATDEFAYLLGADTFHSGRITNPTHPMWHHFETYHVIQQPSYISKYQPAQSLVLAVGKLLGHPIVGSCLATGFSMAALTWMLTGWLPRKYNWLIMLFVLLHPGFHLVWGQAYWGGTLAMAGAALLLGAFVRLNEAFQIKYALIAAAGTVLLANSRPFEGAVLTAVVGLGLITKLVQNKEWRFRPFLMRAILPGFIVLGLGATWTMTYNNAVTGSPFEMPYRVHEAQYGWTPLFLWQTAGEKPVYRHPVMETGYVGDKEATEARFQTLSDIARIKGITTIRFLDFFCGGSFILILFSMPWLLNKSKYKLAFLLSIIAFAAGMATPWEYAHYCAPAAPLVILLLLASWIEFWRRTRTVPMLRIGFAILIITFQVAWTYSVIKQKSTHPQQIWAKNRAATAQQLLDLPGRDLVIVRYSETHVASREWVYNEADIDGAEIVWARGISEEATAELIQYFNDRKVWQLDADAQPPVFNPYPKRLKTIQANLRSRH